VGESTTEEEDTTRYNPENGSLLTEAREFNLMFKTHAGPMADSAAEVYLRPETAQGMFINDDGRIDRTKAAPKRSRSVIALHAGIYAEKGDLGKFLSFGCCCRYLLFPRYYV